MKLNKGKELQNGKYRIIDVLGQGGFGITYLAEQTSLGRKVAIKEFFMKDLCIRDENSSFVSVPSVGSKDLVERFKQKFLKEARTIALFGNAHIIKVHDVFEENGTAYYVMEYLEGRSLKALVDEQGVLPEDVALEYIRQIGKALKVVHAANLLHLDVKPANIMLDINGNAVLIDFGISKHYDDKGSQTSNSGIGMSEGYAPLEQYETGALTKFTPATDIYALGATLYFLLVGTRPPKASEVNDEGLPPMPETLSATVRKAVEGAMQPRRKDRPQSIEQFFELLDGKNAKSSEESEETKIDRRTQNSNIDDSTSLVANPTGNKKGKGWILTIIVLLFVICCAVCCYMFLSNDNGDVKKNSAVVKAVKESAVITNNIIHDTIKQAASLQNEQLIDTATAKPILQESKPAIKSPSKNNSINGYTYVDLALPSGLKWATCNIGASAPGQYGKFYAWGEVVSKKTFSADNLTKGMELGENISGNSAYDAASLEWGASWRIPTMNEFKELIDCCEWEWTTQNGVNGFKVKSKDNGNSIFLPAGGYCSGTMELGRGKNGCYWTSSSYGNNLNGAYFLQFKKDFKKIIWGERRDGQCIRPVSD